MTSNQRRPQDEVVWLLVIVTVGLLLRIWGLASWAWEEDELYTLRDASDLGARAAASGAPGIAARPLYFVLQHFLLLVFPPTRVFLRIAPLVFGVLGIVATWWLGRRAFGGYAGLVGAALAATSPWHLYASQFARYWSLVYLLAAAAFGALISAFDDDQSRLHVRALVLVVLGMLTHPTFLLPLVGVIAAMHLVSREGRLGVIRPSRAALRWLWLPLTVLTFAWFVGLKLGARPQALQDSTGRGIAASLRLVPAMIQWMVPATAAIAAAACIYLVLAEPRVGRRWAAIAIGGTAGAFVLLLVLSVRTAVYSDYGIAALPLLFVAIAGAVELIATRLEPTVAPRFALAAGLGLTASVAPETASHLSDGTRFDYRPAWALIRQLGPDRPVLGRLDPMVEADAPDLAYMPMDEADRLGLPSGFWLIVSVRRLGLREGGPELQAWVDKGCRRIAGFERPRLDYRLYRVELHWCGADPLPKRP